MIIEHGRIVLAGELAELRAKVPQRFVDIRYRGPAPDWSRLTSATVVEAQTARRGCGSAGTPTWPRCWRRSGTAPTSSRSAYQPPTLLELFRQAVAA